MRRPPTNLSCIDMIYNRLRPHNQRISPYFDGVNSSVRLVIVLFSLTFGLCGLATISAQSTIWSEYFTGESGSSTTFLQGDQWQATETTSSQSGTMAIASSAFRFSGASSNTTYTCTWQSNEVAISGYSGLTIVFSSGGSGGTSVPTLSMSNGSLSGSTFTPNPGATSTVITFSFSVPKNKYRTLDNIVLSGTLSCTPSTWYADADGDGLGDSGSTASACDQPSGYVSDSSDLCDDPTACNYDANTNTNASCQTNDACGVCGGSGVDVDSDGVCDDVDSCTDNTACNYLANPTAACSFDQQTWYEDADGDDLGDPAVSQVACAQPTGYVLDNTDPDPSLNPSDYAGTVLYPGDVYFSFAADAASGIQADYIGFTILKDIESGTTLMLAPEWDWDGTFWDGSFSGTLIKWVAPAGGVEAGTEVILVDIDNASVTGDALCDGENNPVVRATGNATLTGGESCGSFEHLLTGRKEFNWETRWAWIFQPDTQWAVDVSGNITSYANAAVGSKSRHLSCIGYDLNYDANTGSGTLIEGSDWSAAMDAAYSYEDANFNQSAAWAYQGGASVLPFAASGTSLVTQQLGQGVSFSAASGATPSYSITGNVYAELPYEPNGCITFSTSATWNGLANGPGIVNPSGNSALDIVVDSGVTLTVDAASEVACKDITVTVGSFASCDGSGRTLAASGNIALGASGTFEGGQGTLRLSGLTAQTIDANNYADPSSSRFQLKDLVVENNKTASIKGHVKMKSAGALTFDASAQTDKLKIDSSVSSSLTFQSSADGTAAIGACEVANFDDGVDQTFTFERYIPADSNGSSWVNIGAYVTGTTVADWTSANSNMLIFEYKESSYGSLGAGWNYLWDASTVLLPGTGYMALIPQGEDAAISVTGAFQIGDVDIDLTFTDDLNQSNTDVDGWNLVSNPFPAPVDFAEVIAETAISTWYVFDNSVDAYVAGGSDAPSTLGVGQSFWVKVEANTTITFSESDKITTDNNTFVRSHTHTYQGTTGLEISNSGHTKARAFVKFQEGTTTAFDESHDALMFNTTAFNKIRVWMVSDSGELLSRQAAGRVDEVESIALTVTTGEGGDLTFAHFVHSEEPENLCVVIEDTETGETAQLGVDSLVVNLPANVLIEDRFVLHFNATPTMTLQSAACSGLTVELEGADFDGWLPSWASADGQESGEGLPNELADGDYIFTYQSVQNGCVEEVAVEVVTACLGDFNENGTRDITDLMVLLAGLPGGNGLSTLGSEVADCNCDGLVTIEDMLTFLSVFSSNCTD